MSLKSKAKKPKVNKVEIKEEEVAVAVAPAEDRLLQDDSEDDEYVNESGGRHGCDGIAWI
jgi:hypothetical protein